MTEMQTRGLQPASQGFQTLFVPSERAIEAKGFPGEIWICSICQFVIASGVRYNQILGISFLCPSCGTVVDSPARLPGQPLTLSIVADAGTFFLGEPIMLTDDGVAIYSRDTVQEYEREIGKASQRDASFALMDAQGLRVHAYQLQRLLGDAYPKLKAEAERAISSGNPQRVHWGYELVRYARSVARDLETNRTGSFDFDAMRLAHLPLVAQTLERWAQHPQYPALKATLAHDTEAQHTVALLLTAAWLADIGFGIEIVPAKGFEKAPDLRVMADVWTLLDTELKTPLVLRYPEHPITREVADSAIRKCLSKSSRQIASESYMLFIGSYGLSPRDHEMLENRAMHEFRRYHRRNLLAIAFVNIANVVLTGQGPPTIAPQTVLRLAENPFHQGRAKIVRGEPRDKLFHEVVRSPPKE
ncbi:hypothetical protein [Herbiconiux sp.]|uniref:hypothetical protein n=1 Tax=Herbiconiux sp. TaxID=1871186 RepID=UPI0025C3B22E|nr:hypothetical protein [Herbiconiux sp.]